MLWMLFNADKPKKPWLFFLGIGLLLGLATSFKQTLIASGITITFFITIKRLYDRDWKGLLDLLWLGLGFSAIWLVWVALFSAQHALSDFWEQVFYFELFNNNVSYIERLNDLLNVIRHLAETLPLFNLGLLLWFVAVLFLFFNEMSFRKALSSRWLGGLILVSAVLLVLTDSSTSTPEAYIP